MEEEKKKTAFLFLYLTYLPLFLLKFQSGELIGCGIKFRIQRVPTRHTFDRLHYPKNKKYLKKRHDDIREICQKYEQKSSFFYDTYRQIYIKKLLKRFSLFEF